MENLEENPTRDESQEPSTSRHPLADHRSQKDAIIVICLSLTAIVVGGYFDLFERWHIFVRSHEYLELDELTIGIFSFAILLIWYSWRQQKQADLLKLKALYHEEKASKASKAKSEFLALISHDLRTPLNAILGFSDMMRTKVYGPLGNSHYEEYANDIHYSGMLLVNIINDVLDLSKIEAGKFELIEKPLDISSIIQVSSRQLVKMVEASNQTISTDVPCDMPALRGDERALIQILNNLLSNAIKFTPDNGTISVATKVDEGNRILLSVRDTGIGMSEDDIGKVLEPFEQIGDAYSQRYKGTGLGLYICSNFMQSFGGALEIKSDTGKGTTVTLQFPQDRTIHLH